MIPGYSASSDIELNMQDKTGGDLNHFFDVVNDYTAALEARPEINSAKTSFNPNFPQYMLDIDAATCKKAGLSPSDILSTMQGYFGGLYASNFNSFGKMYRVMIQAEPNATKIWNHSPASRCVTAMRWLPSPSSYPSRRYTVRISSAVSTFTHL